MIKMQLGKQGVTSGFLQGLKKAFTNCENIRISVLKSACRDRQELGQIAEQITTALGQNYTHKIIGFTIALKKWRKPRKQR